MTKIHSTLSVLRSFLFLLLGLLAWIPWGRYDVTAPFAVASDVSPPTETNDSDEDMSEEAKCEKDLQVLKLFALRLGDMRVAANQNLLFKAYEAYCKVILAAKIQGVRESAVRALQANLNQTMEFYKGGVLPKTDVLAIHTRVALAESKLEECGIDVAKFVTRLNLILKYPLNKEWKSEACFEHSVIPYSEPEIYRLAIQHRPDLVEKGISFEEATSALSTDGPGSEISTFVREVMAQIRIEYQEMKRLWSVIPGRQRAIEFSTEVFRMQRERYKEQAASYVEVLESQRQLAQAQEDYYIDFVNYKIKRAALESQMGILHRLDGRASHSRQ